MVVISLTDYEIFMFFKSHLSRPENAYTDTYTRHFTCLTLCVKTGKPFASPELRKPHLRAKDAHICTFDTKNIPTLSSYSIKKNWVDLKDQEKDRPFLCVLINACVIMCRRSGDKHSSECVITSFELPSRTALRDFSTIHSKVIGTSTPDVFPMINTWIILLKEEVWW